jgi:hypothetical protein
MSEGEKQWFFKDSDFEPFSANDEQDKVKDLQARYKDMFTFEVQSSNYPDRWYEVTHNLKEITGCQCIAGGFSRRCKHKIRGEVVLYRRKQRVYERDMERKQQARRDKSSLNTGNTFQFDR